MENLFDEIKAIQDLPKTAFKTLTEGETTLLMSCLQLERELNSLTVSDYLSGALDDQSGVLENYNELLKTAMSSPLMSVFSNHIQVKGLSDRVTIGSFLMISDFIQSPYEVAIWCYSLFKALKVNEQVVTMDLLNLTRLIISSGVPTELGMERLWDEQKDCDHLAHGIDFDGSILDYLPLYCTKVTVI